MNNPNHTSSENISKTIVNSKGNDNINIAESKGNITVHEHKHLNILSQTKTVIRVKHDFLAPEFAKEEYIDRSEVSDFIKPKLLNESQDTIKLSIQGLPGVGKTQAALSIFYDKKVKSYFSNCYWISLGEKSNFFKKKYSNISLLLTSFINTLQSKQGTLSTEEKTLLVIDDVWKNDDIKKILKGNYISAVLITTRFKEIAIDFSGKNSYELQPMNLDESLKLLSKELKKTTDYSIDNNSLDTKKLIKILGGLPLAIKLSAHLLIFDTLEKVLEKLKDEKTRLNFLSKEDVYNENNEDILNIEGMKESSILASFNLSLEALENKEGIETVNKFLWLGLIHKKAIITPELSATLWNTNKDDADDTLKKLLKKGLISSVISTSIREKKYVIHDLLVDFARMYFQAQPESTHKKFLISGIGLGLTKQKAHKELLERYKGQQRTKGLWHTLNNDGYIYKYLVWHMLEAGMENEIHQLLTEKKIKIDNNGIKTEKNGWFEEKERLGQIGGFIEDVQLAYKSVESDYKNLVQKDFDGKNKSYKLSLLCQYSLMISSVRSFSRNIPPDLLIALAESEIDEWNFEKSLDYVLAIPVYDLQSLKIKKETLEYFEEIYDFKKVNSNLISEIKNQLNYLNKKSKEFLNIIANIDNKNIENKKQSSYRSSSSQFNNSLTTDSLMQHIKNLHCYKNKFDVARDMKALIPEVFKLPIPYQQKVIDDILNLIKDQKLSNHCVYNLLLIAPYLKDQTSKKKLLRCVQKIFNPYVKADTLTQLSKLENFAMIKKHILEQAYKITSLKNEEWNLMYTKARLVCQIPSSFQSRNIFIDQILNVNSQFYGDLLCEIAFHSPDLKEYVFFLTEKISDNREKNRVIKKLRKLNRYTDSIKNNESILDEISKKAVNKILINNLNRLELTTDIEEKDLILKNCSDYILEIPSLTIRLDLISMIVKKIRFLLDKNKINTDSITHFISNILSVKNEYQLDSISAYIVALSPLIFDLEGTRSLIKIIGAINDIEKWWT